MSVKQKRQLKIMQESLEHFTQAVKHSPFKKDILKIIVYGSMVDKNINSGSDIDVAIVAKHPNKVEDKIDDITYNILLRYGELIEPIIYSALQYKNPRSPFLRKILQEGKEVYA